MQYYNGNAYFSGAAHFSSASPAAQEEKTAIDRATPPIENNGESSHDENSLIQKFAYLRERNHTVGRVMSPKRTPNRNVNNVNGYKYRILKTPPQLTTNPLTTPTSTSSQMIEKEYNNDALYQNTVHNRTTSTAPRKPLQSEFQSSIRNRRSSLSLEEMISSNTYNGFLPDERTNQEEEEEEENISERIKVRSVQAASSIDVVAVLSKVFGGGTWKSQSTRREADKQLLAGVNHHPLTDFFASSPPIRHVFGRTNIIIQLSPPSIDCPPSLSHSVPRYVAIYRFGSVVFFNFTTKEASLLLKQIKKHSVDPISVGFERREHFEVALQPELEAVTGNITADRAMVRELDMYTVGIVSNIMGKTVALDWHNDTVDELLANFSTVNSSVERTGGFTSMERHTLFQVVARNNSLFIEMVGKLGIKDRSDTAWHLSQYEGLHEEMRKEFDLDQRFKVSCDIRSAFCEFLISLKVC